ncbi:unnamed protein product, partial [Musa hybrid cultivar]
GNAAGLPQQADQQKDPCQPNVVSLLPLPKDVEDLRLTVGYGNVNIFTYSELSAATKNFRADQVLGEGGFGIVYKGIIDENVRPGFESTQVAVKKLNPEGVQGDKEWLAEVNYLGQLSHPNLVKLIGYCCEDDHRLLVYEYMACGSLEKHLFRRVCLTMQWSTRMKIALGAANGLAFLHGAERPIIYRDFKTSNILLDSAYNPKLSDFGLAKEGPIGDQTHVSTRVVGTQGYAAPEYIMTGHLTARSDVYGFGVVLLEILTGKKAVDKSRPAREQNLVDWARPLLPHSRKLPKIMDPRIEGQYSSTVAAEVAGLALRCLSQNPKGRPTMNQVVDTLESVQDPHGSREEVLLLFEAPKASSSDSSSAKKGEESRRRSKQGKGRSKSEPPAGFNDKSSQNALKWALDNVAVKGQTIFLVHVITKLSAGHQEDVTSAASQLLVPFRCFCKRKNVRCKDIILEDTDLAKAIVDFVSHAGVEKLIVGASKGGFVRSFRYTDVSTNICKSVPDFCTVYIISKGKISSMRNAVRSAPVVTPLRSQILKQPSSVPEPVVYQNSQGTKGNAAFETRNLYKEKESIRSPLNSATRVQSTKSKEETMSGSDEPFFSSGKPSIDHLFPQRLSCISDGLDCSFESVQSPHRSSLDAYSSRSGFSPRSNGSFSSQMSEEVKAEMNRLKLELKQTMDMYSTACREALTAKQKAMELHRWKMEEQQRLEEARLAEEAALILADKEKAKCKAALEAAEAAKRIAELEAQKRINAEMQALQEPGKKKSSSILSKTDLRYRKYTIEDIEAATENFAENRKIGEGGYGPVYRCYLDHTPVAIKALRPDASQGRSQFQQEVEILSCIRHPNMVLLLGACPEYGCLVYEYMANGSLEDRLYRRGNTPPIPWQHRFRIAAEIGTGLLFLHQTKPEPLVHRDLKPANILLDQYYVSKISDVGLARLVPPSVADSVTQYHMTSAAGTFCYIDPEYQQTGMLGIKSDIYSFGVLLLQLLTGKPPMGLTHHVERSIEKGTFADMLDPAVQDWPVEEALGLLKLALKCAELRRKDRPDLGTIILPELNRLRTLGEENMQHFVLRNCFRTSNIYNQIPMQVRIPFIVSFSHSVQVS